MFAHKKKNVQYKWNTKKLFTSLLPIFKKYQICIFTNGCSVLRSQADQTTFKESCSNVRSRKDQTTYKESSNDVISRNEQTTIKESRRIIRSERSPLSIVYTAVSSGLLCSNDQEIASNQSSMVSPLCFMYHSK